MPRLGAKPFLAETLYYPSTDHPPCSEATFIYLLLYWLNTLRSSPVSVEGNKKYIFAEREYHPSTEYPRIVYLYLAPFLWRELNILLWKWLDRNRNRIVCLPDIRSVLIIIGTIRQEDPWRQIADVTHSLAPSVHNPTTEPNEPLTTEGEGSSEEREKYTMLWSSIPAESMNNPSTGPNEPLTTEGEGSREEREELWSSISP